MMHGMEDRENARPNLVIVTGLSGAGKSQAMKCFEDQGYYCVDNLPPVLIPQLAQLCRSSHLDYLALALDVRSREFFDDLEPALEQIATLGYHPYIVFLEADPQVLVRRYAESRRQHPLAPNDRVLKGIEKEREFLQFLRGRSDLVLDTSKISPHQLRGLIFQNFGTQRHLQSRLHVFSFGFKYGIPLDTDLVFDCRFLPNPYYLAELRPLSGLDEAVYQYLSQFESFATFQDKIADLLLFLLPAYLKEGKRQVNVAFGCTGGRHRSVALAERIAQRLASAHYEVSIEHRDLQRHGGRSALNSQPHQGS